MPENERIVLSGFRYEIEEGQIHEEGKAGTRRVVVLRLHDDDRGISAESWWPEEAWEAFRQDVNGGVFVPSRDAIEKLGI